MDNDPYSYISDPEIREKLRAADAGVVGDPLISKLEEVQQAIKDSGRNQSVVEDALAAIGTALVALQGSDNESLVYYGQEAQTSEEEAEVPEDVLGFTDL